jgi:hypothetical protein
VQVVKVCIFVGYSDILEIRTLRSCEDYHQNCQSDSHTSGRRFVCAADLLLNIGVVFKELADCVIW